jgi:hypothetical protein
VLDTQKFDEVCADLDPVQRARRAAALATYYQQRAAELALVRKEAIEEAHRDLGLSYTEIASALGISKGRITQIRTATSPRGQVDAAARPTPSPTHSVSVAGVVVDDRGRVLVVRRRDTGAWEAPGGVLEID